MTTPPLLPCQQRGYELGVICAVPADCARNGCALARILPPTPAPVGESERERFDAWMDTTSGFDEHDEQIAWAAWEGCAALARQQAAPSACPFGCVTQEEHDAHYAAPPAAERVVEAAREYQIARDHFHRGKVGAYSDTLTAYNIASAALRAALAELDRADHG